MWPNPQETADLVTFTEEILNGKLYFLLCKDSDDWSVNPLTANAPHHIDTSQLIFNSNQLTGFYIMGNIGR